MRIACLLVPDLPIRAELRANPELSEVPLVITDGPGNQATILAASLRARHEGVREGLSLPQARALTRDLVVRIASPVLERATRETLLDIALSLAPRAELAPRGSGLFVSEGGVYLDASGIDALHDNERTFASVFRARAEQAGLPGFVALASSRSIAHLAARHLAYPLTEHPTEHPTERSESPDNETIQILSPDKELDFLSPLPIDLLDPNDRTAEALTRFGIYRIRDLLRLPRRDLAARLGPEILDLVRKASGEEVEAPLPTPDNTCLEEGIDLEAPIARLEPLAFVLRGLISRLAERLELRSLGCVCLRIELSLENGGRENRHIGLSSSTQDTRILLRLLRLEMETNPPIAAIESVSLSCEGVPLRREQLDFFLPRGPSPSELDQTLAELNALCGPERVGSPALVDDHRPDAFTLTPFTPKLAVSETPLLRSQSRRRRRFTPDLGHAAPRSKPSTRSPNRLDDDPANNAEGARVSARGPRLTLRAFRPPLRAEVRIEAGSPAFVRSAISQGKVLRSAGPWRTTGQWWSESAHFAIDHYDIQMSDGLVLRLCFDWKQKWWQIDGLYD